MVVWPYAFGQNITAVGVVVKESCSARKQNREAPSWQTGNTAGTYRNESEQGISPGHTPNNLLPPTRPYLLIFTTSIYCHNISNSTRD
jgi:hypothetical protein